MFEIFLMSKKPIVAYIAGAKVLVSKDMPKKMEILDAKNFCINYHFANESSNMFCVNLDFQSAEPTIFGDNCIIARLGENKYILHFCKKNACFLQKKCTKIQKNNLFFNFYQNGIVEIESEIDVKFSEFYDIQIMSADVLELNNGYYAIKLFGRDDEKCIVINNSFAEILCFDTCIVERTETGFKTLTNLYDIAGHGLVEIFKIDEDIKKLDQYTVYMNGEAQTEFNINALPLYFLQCIKAGDFSLAKKCLALSLQSKVKPDHLKQFFGDFVDAYFLNDRVYLEYAQTKNFHSSKSFMFVIEKDAIKEIL